MLRRLLDRLIERPPGFFRLTVPGGCFRLYRDRPTVFLTFDDGPIPEVTPWVLDLLDSYGVKATFFMVGQNAGRYPELVEEVRRRGHAVGNHTLHHLNGAEVTTRRYVRDTMEADAILRTRLFRPPHGWLRPRQARILRRTHTIVMYDLVTRDYSRFLTAERVFDNVRRYARPGSIIVFHDSVKSWPRLREALPRSIAWLLEQGYGFETIGESPPNRIHEYGEQRNGLPAGAGAGACSGCRRFRRWFSLRRGSGKRL